MVSISLFPGRYVQGLGALSRLGQACAGMGRKAFVIALPYSWQHLLPAVMAVLKEQCGVLASLFLTDKAPALIEQVYGFCQAVGLPTTLSDLGLEEVADQELRRVAEKACAPGETMHKEPYETSPEVVVDAIKAADARGRRGRRPGFHDQPGKTCERLL
ncbi:MAG: iron-containing alcohol dehydrogenase [Desulfarculaceae bacterium]|nr:iron-containing alcohol dehydrogenase [Desulfarculaceae bacterium]MCF8122993.1 iron-containing alcohol dehydrogenase [Desulfarculaceae bacterium]